MTGTLNKVVIFTAGVVIGSAVTWKYFKTKYERIAKEEIDSVREVFTQHYAKDEEDDVILDDETGEPVIVKTSTEPVDIREFAAKIQKSKYVSYATPDKEVDVVFEDDGYIAPYPIAPEDFGELEDYETYNLTHYKDGTLTDISGNIIEDVEGAVGNDYASHFGEYEDDSVHIRNDRLKIDYEILADERNYADVINKTPHSVEGE